jgi:2,3-bisphosphoglycerate-dependent phosphoglycerate mutase
VHQGESTWNQENKFTGWVDVPLSGKGKDEAAEGGQILNDAGFKFDMAFTSTLKRAIKTCDYVLEATDSMWVPVVKDWRLNER